MGDAGELLTGFGMAITGDVAALDRVASGDIEFRDSMQATTGVAALRPYLNAWATAFPDASIEFRRILEGDDEAAGEIVYRGTHTGPLTGPQGVIAATGRTVELRGSVWVTIQSGRITSFRGYYDTAAMMMQLGVIPAAVAS